MRILIFANSSLFFHQHLLGHIRRLAVNHSLLVFTSDRYFLQNFPSSVEIVTFPFSRTPAFNDLLLLIRFCFLRLSFKPSISLSFTPKPALINCLSSLFPGLTVHYFTGLRWQLFCNFKRLFYLTIDKLVFYLSDNVFFDSFSQADYFLDSIGSSLDSSLFVAGNGSLSGIDLTLFYPRKPCRVSVNYLLQSSSLNSTVVFAPQDLTDSFSFGYVGRICQDKGIDVILSSFEFLLRSFPSSYLFLVGPLECSNALVERISSLSQVIHIDFVSEPAEVYSLFDCYVSASFREGFGVSILEAMACGLPVISTDIPGPSDFLRNGINSLLVKPNDVSSLTSAMTHILANPDLRQSLIKNSLQTVSLYSHQHVLENFENLLIQLY